MGDQARVVFYSPSRLAISPIVYLHLHGGFALSLIEAALPRMRTKDAAYSCARFIGTCHEGISGNTGLGIFNLPDAGAKAGESPRDAYRRQLDDLKGVEWEVRGMFLVDVDHWRVRHAGSRTNAYGDTGDGFGMQEDTALKAVRGVVQLPADLASR